jgi:hypothetical protein
MEKENTYSGVVGSFITENSSSWHEYYELSISTLKTQCDFSVGRMLQDPIGFDKDVYLYFESKYSEKLSKCIGNTYQWLIQKHNKIAEKIDQDYVSLADWESVWKQTIPFMVLADFFDLDKEVVDEFIGCFVFEQAIPSKLFDQILDENLELQSSNSWWGISRVISTSLDQKLANLPLVQTSRQKLSSYSGYMCEKMIQEYSQRYDPDKLDISIENMICNDPGLNASVFFRATFEVAASMINSDTADTADTVRNIGHCLALVRQVNDEICDLDDDVVVGVISLPIVAACQDEIIKSRILANLKKIWNSQEVETNTKLLREAVIEGGGFEKSARVSCIQLNKAFNWVSQLSGTKYPAELFLLVGLRLSLLSRLEQKGWLNGTADSIYSLNYDPELKQQISTVQK